MVTRLSVRFDPHPLNALITISNLPTQSQPVFMTPWHDITYPSRNWSHMPWRLTRKKCLSLTREWVIVPFVLSFFKVTDAYFVQGMAKGFSNERRQHHRIEYHQGDKRSIVGSRSPIFLAHIKGSVGQSWEEVSLINLRDVETRKPFSYIPGVGGNNAPFANLSVSKIFDPVKVLFMIFASHVYLNGVTAAELRRHLSNMNLIFNSQHIFWRCWKIRKITERRKLA